MRWAAASSRHQGACDGRQRRSALTNRLHAQTRFALCDSGMSILEPLARAILYLSLALVVGVPIATLSAVLPALRRLSLDTAGVSAALVRWTWGAAALVLIGGLALFIAQFIPLELALEGFAEWLEFLRLTLLGQMLIVRVGLGALALLTLWLASKGRVSLRTAMIACPLIGAAAHATLAGTSHSAAMDAGLMPVLADLAHLFAGALWCGGLVGVLVTCTHLRRTVGEMNMHAAAREMTKRFSPLASLGIMLASGTGLVLSSIHLPEAGSLSTSSYGQLILLKVGLVVAVLLIGARLRQAIYHRSNAIDRLLFAEAVIACGIFVSAALLTSTAPPHEMIVHQMADGTVHAMAKVDLDFQRLLFTLALAVFAAGAFMVALEWARSLKGSLR